MYLRFFEEAANLVNSTQDYPVKLFSNHTLILVVLKIHLVFFLIITPGIGLKGFSQSRNLVVIIDTFIGSQKDFFYVKVTHQDTPSEASYYCYSNPVYQMTFALEISSDSSVLQFDYDGNGSYLEIQKIHSLKSDTLIINRFEMIANNSFDSLKTGIEYYRLKQTNDSIRAKLYRSAYVKTINPNRDTSVIGLHYVINGNEYSTRCHWSFNNHGVSVTSISQEKRIGILRRKVRVKTRSIRQYRIRIAIISL